MRFFTDKDGNFNWAAIGAICAVVGSALAIFAFFAPVSTRDVTEQNIQTVLGDYFVGDKVEGITIEEYEKGLERRETQIVDLLKDTNISAEDAESMRQTLTRIDARQSNLQSSYKDVEKLTAEIRTYHENIADQELVQKAILDIFDGNAFSAAEKAIDAGIPITKSATIEEATSIFQTIQTEADFLRYIAGKELALSTDENYIRKYGRNGSMDGFWWSNRNGTGSWAFIDGKYAEEFTHDGKHYPQYFPEVSVSRSAVKFKYGNGDVAIYSIN